MLGLLIAAQLTTTAVPPCSRPEDCTTTSNIYGQGSTSTTFICNLPAGFCTGVQSGMLSLPAPPCGTESGDMSAVCTQWSAPVLPEAQWSACDLQWKVVALQKRVQYLNERISYKVMGHLDPSVVASGKAIARAAASVRHACSTRR